MDRADGLDEIKVGVNPETIKTYRVVCSCNTRFLFKIPAEVTHLPCVKECPSCNRGYVMEGGELWPQGSDKPMVKIEGTERQPLLPAPSDKWVN